MFIKRKKAAGPTTVAPVLEAHGSYSPVTEKAINSYNDISGVEVLVNNKDYTIIKLKTKENKNWLVALANQNEEKQHAIKVEGKDLSWNGPFKLLKF